MATLIFQNENEYYNSHRRRSHRRRRLCSISLPGWGTKRVVHSLYRESGADALPNARERIATRLVNTNIFSEPRFMALIDLATPIAPGNRGRLDPFAPVPAVSGK